MEGSAHTHPRGYAPCSSQADKEASKANIFKNKPMYIISEKGVRKHLPGFDKKDIVIIDVDDFLQWIEENILTKSNDINNKRENEDAE